MVYNDNHISFGRVELAEILKKHLNIDDEINTRVIYGNAGFTLYLEKPKQPTHEELAHNYAELKYPFTLGQSSLIRSMFEGCRAVAIDAFISGRESRDIPPETE